MNYTKISWDEWQNQPRDLNEIEWDVADTKLLINSEGCGYPPRVNCSEFAKEYGYGNVYMLQKTFYIQKKKQKNVSDTFMSVNRFHVSIVERIRKWLSHVSHGKTI